MKRELCLSWARGHGQALCDVCFTIHPGEAVALVGHNGAGKTTIVKLLTRLYDPDEGQILVNGRDIKEYDLEALRTQIGVIFQDYVTYYLTASRNIGVGKVEALDDLEAMQAAAAAAVVQGLCPVGANKVTPSSVGPHAVLVFCWGGERGAGSAWPRLPS